MNILYDKIAESCADFLTPDSRAKERLEVYADMLTDWNTRMNLTAITDPEGISLKHYTDCLYIFKYADIPLGAEVIDVGTGAGFPGVVMKIVRPDIKLTLLDSLGKRITFLNALCNELGLEGVITIHERAENGAQKFREKYDVAVARAVAAMNVLSEYCLPYVKVGGKFIAMKGASAREETENAASAIEMLGGELNRIECFNLGGCGERGIITVKKISHTPTKYPRNPSKIAKEPL